AFGREIIASYDTYFANKLDTYLLDDAFPPLVRLSNFVDDAKEGMARHNFTRGCLVGNLGQEVDLLPDAFRQQLIDVFLSWQARVAHCLKVSQEQGTLSSTADGEKLAEQFWIGWEGAVSRAKLIQSNTPLDDYLHYFITNLPK
ncbi:MAG: TetR/AcrR family transcriptional repressor of nem operon, partial [Kiritimatiellia bacterium]